MTNPKRLKKEQVTAGLIFEVRSDRPLSNGLEWFDKGSGLNTNFNNSGKASMEVLFPVVATHKFDIYAQYQRSQYQVGAQFEVVVEPKKRAESHTVVVKDLITGQEGFIHWNEFSACCVPVQAVVNSNTPKKLKL